MYDNGFGVPRDTFEAVVLFQKACRDREPAGCFNLGQGMNVESVSTRTSEKRSSTMDERVI